MTDKPQEVLNNGNASDNRQVALNVMDVLLRHLESAKQVHARASANPETADHAKDRFCTLGYARPGTLCPIAYWEPGQ